jgi:hypothetical protein|tara:strand:- start:47 stop:1042 length:996 start_codon:yes stop_codon:yes gene_type:complete
MAVNSAFHTGSSTSTLAERNLYQELITESIQIFGHDCHYIDRESVGEDTFLGEDALSKFVHARKIEMYTQDVNGWEGDDLLMSKFGLQDMSAVTFVVSVPRFQDLTQQIAIETATDTTGGAILLEDASIDQSSDSSTLAGDFYLLKDTAPDGNNRPFEGDLIFHPIFKMLFEVKSVEDEEPFYQVDNLPVYKMQCQIFDYSSEKLDTGVTAIDAIEDNLSTDTLLYQFTLEQSSAVNENIRIHDTATTRGLLKDETDNDNIIGEDDSTSVGESLLLETGEFLLQEGYILGQGERGDSDIDRQAQNELFDELDDTILDFTENNPFGDVGSVG